MCFVLSLHQRAGYGQGHRFRNRCDAETAGLAVAAKETPAGLAPLRLQPPSGTNAACRHPEAAPCPAEPPGAPRAGRCGRAQPRGPAAGRRRLSARQAPAPRRRPAPSADFYICAPFRSRVTCPAPRPIGSALWSGQWKGRGQWARRLAWRQPMGAGLC